MDSAHLGAKLDAGHAAVYAQAMPFLDQCTPIELADLLQQAYAADHDLPGEHLTDPETRHELARMLDRDDELKEQVVDAWLQDQLPLEEALMYWFDAEFLGLLDD